MTAQEAWLIDKSALGRLINSPDTGLWFDRIERGLVRVTTPTVLEVGFSSRSGQDWRAAVREPPVGLMPVENMTPQVEDRAVAVQGQLAAEGKHRAPSVADLLIAATAELSGLTVLHVDKDFELIAELTGQLVERLRVA